MASNDGKMHVISACEMEVSPAEVFAGADITIKARVSCSEACDLRGKTLLIVDHEGVLVDRAELTELHGEANETPEVVVKAPVKAGAYAWMATFPSQENDGISHQETSAPISFIVKPHPTNVSVWGVPSAITSGDRFGVNVGIKCLAECKLADKEFEIYDHEGRQVASGTVRGGPWPGTTGLYFAEVELGAPATEGYYKWEVKSPISHLEPPHAESSSHFGVRVVRPSECEVTIRAIDKDDDTPIEGVQVVMHPYRALTDQHGVAVLRVSRGAYQLRVSGFKYCPFQAAVDATEDMEIRAELYWQPHFEEDELYSGAAVLEHLRQERAAHEKEQLRRRRRR